jgi:TIR domain
LEGLLISQIEFELLAAKMPSTDRVALRQRNNYPKTAFASYASAGRIDVYRSVQGIKKGRPDLEIWLDSDKLQSGDGWEEQIKAHISTSDIKYLFWSSNAGQSEWVSREWRLGLRQKWLEFIDPFPLESLNFCRHPKS